MDVVVVIAVNVTATLSSGGGAAVRVPVARGYVNDALILGRNKDFNEVGVGNSLISVTGYILADGIDG